MALKGKNSFSIWSSFLGDIIKEPVSKVAIWKRLNKLQIECLQAILEETF